MCYSFTKRNSRLIALLLVLTMVAALFTGCFGAKAPEETNPSEDSNVPPGLVDVKPTEEPTEPTETEPVLSENSAIVNTDQLSVRSSPSVGSPPIGTLEKGEIVEVIDTRTSLGIQWARISKGWVAAEYLDFNFDPNFGNDEPAATEPNESGNQGNANTESIKGVITATELYIRKEANTGSKSVGSYVKGDVVTILETKKVGDAEIASRVSVQLQLTDPAAKSRDRVVKKGEKAGLYTALDFGSVWLERALSGK